MHFASSGSTLVPFQCIWYRKWPNNSRPQVLRALFHEGIILVGYLDVLFIWEDFSATCGFGHPSVLKMQYTCIHPTVRPPSFPAHHNRRVMLILHWYFQSAAATSRGAGSCGLQRQRFFDRWDVCSWRRISLKIWAKATDYLWWMKTIAHLPRPLHHTGR